MEHAEKILSKPPETEHETIHQRVLKVATGDSGKILIVEDEVELAEILEFNLIRHGFDVLIAVDGLEACRVIGREKPDLILLDLLLPLLDGWEICRMVRSHHDPQIAKTPIIMLSALGSPDDRIRGYDLGADLYLPKPYVIKEVIIKAQQLVVQHQERLKLTKEMSSLQQFAELQDQWQQVLFHELRNQLTVISGMAEHLQDSTTDLEQNHSIEFAGQIVDSSHYLGTLAENYLLVRNVENNPAQLQTEMILLHELLQEVVQLFKSQAVQKACDLELD
ncbi:MAG: response regulator, partial [Thermodesulfobacteriota bacterium]|nr:response regulator [Thermodesulfobacteriota bacterium]